jgi:hypothetical protein
MGLMSLEKVTSFCVDAGGSLLTSTSFAEAETARAKAPSPMNILFPFIVVDLLR